MFLRHQAHPAAPLQSNGGVAQWIERRITNPMVAGSTPAPATNDMRTGYSMRKHRVAVTGRTREGTPITPGRVIVL